MHVKINKKKSLILQYKHKLTNLLLKKTLSTKSLIPHHIIFNGRIVLILLVIEITIKSPRQINSTSHD